MSKTVRVSRKELSSTDVLRELDGGNRVLIEVDILGKTMRMAIRRQDDTYYCDTPVKLLTYETRAEMRACLERYRLATPAGETAPSDASDEAADATADESAGT